MYKNVIADIPGIEYYPIVALIFFFGFFICLMVWYFRADRQKLESIALMAIRDDYMPEQVPNSSERN
ncbi:MAG: hypothetical protein HYX66_01580 [Ignavibacteria bacterium]|nr:hypothetical protein [Ignavibacteria bacterium]